MQAGSWSWDAIRKHLNGLSTQTSKCVCSKTAGSLWCKSCPEVALHWLILGDSAHWSLCPTHCSVEESLMALLQQRQAWEMGKGQYRGEKEQARALEKTLFVAHKFSFSLPTSKPLPWTFLLKSYWKSHAVCTLWTQRWQPYRMFCNSLQGCWQFILIQWVSASTHQHVCLVLSVHVMAARSLTWISSAWRMGISGRNEFAKPIRLSNSWRSYKSISSERKKKSTGTTENQH